MKTVAEHATVKASHASSRMFFPNLQAKLAVNAPGDKHEREADATAERVMRMPAAPTDERLLQRAAHVAQ